MTPDKITNVPSLPHEPVVTNTHTGSGGGGKYMTTDKVEEKSQSEEWRAWKFVSEMLDTPDETGIYHTSKCYEQIHDFVVEQKQKAVIQYRQDLIEDILKMADALETECNKDGDKGTKQWMAFKGFRNTIRDKYIIKSLSK